MGTLSLIDGTGLASNYSLASGTFDVNSRQVNISGSRIFDGTTVVSGTDLVVTTGVGSEILTVTGTGSISNANKWFFMWSLRKIIRGKNKEFFERKIRKTN